MLPANKLPAVIAFDWDNTLIDNWPAITAALNAAFRVFGLPEWDNEKAKLEAHRSLRDSFPEWFGANWEQARDVFYKTLEGVHLQTLQTKPGAAELLAWLSKRRQKMAVISNKTGHYLRREVTALSWDHYFSTIIGAGDAARDKPNPEPMVLMWQQLGVANDSVWYVGDLPSDVAFAKAGGALPIIVSQQPKFHDMQFESCGTLLAAFEQLT